VVHQGAEIGVLERIEISDLAGVTLLHVRGGVSGALEYIVPSNAVPDVHEASRRAYIDGNVTFEPAAIAEDGRVILVATVPGPEESRNRPKDESAEP
jgi:hypothetical protein